MKEDEQTSKTIPMPAWMRSMIEDRLEYYDPPMTFVDWARRVFWKELSKPPGMLPDWTGRVREEPGGAPGDVC